MEQQIIASVLNGNTNAFAKLIEKYADMVFSIAYRILRNTEDAEEVAQDAFLKAFNALKYFRNDSKFSTWLYQIVYNTAINRARTQFKETSYENYNHINESDFEVYSSELVNLESQDRRIIIEKMLSQMSPDESLSLTLYYLEECSIEEIASITGWRESNVKVKLFRSRKKFYELLKDYMKTEIDILL